MKPDIEAIRQSPRQYVDLETIESLSDYAMVLEGKVEALNSLCEFNEKTMSALLNQNQTLHCALAEARANDRHAMEYLTEIREKTGIAGDFPALVDGCGALRDEVRSLQYRIDELMIEYCPDEMTPEQMAEYDRNQRSINNYADALRRMDE